MTVTTPQHIVIGEDPTGEQDTQHWFLMRTMDCEEILLSRRALKSAKTWAELFCALTPLARSQLILSLEDWELEDLQSMPFDSWLIPCIADGDWPPMPGVLVVERPAWMPSEVYALGHRVATALNGDILSFPTEVLDEVQRLLNERGFRCSFDSASIREAWGC